ncbi:MAG TPA: hypothetical protein VIV35_07180 [Chitinophagaceae bacterium]
MNKLEILSNIFSGFGLLFYAIFQLTKNALKWPAFIADNYEYIAFGSIAMGYILTVIYYFRTKNAKKARQLLLSAAIITVICVAIYYLS